MHLMHTSIASFTYSYTDIDMERYTETHKHIKLQQLGCVFRIEPLFELMIMKNESESYLFAVDKNHCGFLQISYRHSVNVWAQSDLCVFYIILSIFVGNAFIFIMHCCTHSSEKLECKSIEFICWCVFVYAFFFRLGKVSVLFIC